MVNAAEQWPVLLPAHWGLALARRRAGATVFQTVHAHGHLRSVWLGVLKFNSYYINVLLNIWSTKYRLITCICHRLEVIYETNLLSLISLRLKTFCQIRRKCYSVS
jgi:hypothetical protein